MLYLKQAYMSEELADRIKLGDKYAFELLFREYYVHLCKFANKFLHDPEEAKEIVQEAFTKIWEEREGINSEESVKAYIFRITQNNSISRLRKKKVESKYIEILSLVYIDYKQFSSYEKIILLFIINDA